MLEEFLSILSTLIFEYYPHTMESKVEALWRHMIRAASSDSNASLPNIHVENSHYDDMNKFPLVCVIDGDGIFIHICDRLHKLLRIPPTILGLNIGRLLDVNSALHVVKVIGVLKESEEGRIEDLVCTWQSLVILDDAMEDCEWCLTGSPSQSRFLLIGCHYAMNKAQKKRFIQISRNQFLSSFPPEEINEVATSNGSDYALSSRMWNSVSTGFSTLSSSLGTGFLEQESSNLGTLSSPKRRPSQSAADLDFQRLQQNLFGPGNAPVCFFDTSGLIFFVSDDFFDLFRSDGPNIGTFLTSSSYSAIRRQCAEWKPTNGLVAAGCEWLPAVKRSSDATDDYDWYLTSISSFFVLYGRFTFLIMMISIKIFTIESTLWPIV